MSVRTIISSGSLIVFYMFLNVMSKLIRGSGKHRKIEVLCSFVVFILFVCLFLFGFFVCLKRFRAIVETGDMG